VTNKRKKVLVYPCGTEIGLEIYKAVEYSTYFELWGGSSSYDHGRYVYRHHIDNLPFITDNSDEDLIIEFQEKIKKYNIDYIYPAMDGVLSKFSQYKSLFKQEIIAPESGTTRITRSKRLTYQLLENCVKVPRVYEEIKDITVYPIFVKPDIGQGSKGAQKIDNADELLNLSFDNMILMEYLPGDEYTVDCFTNNEGKLIYASPRYRKRINDGISINSCAAYGNDFINIALAINDRLEQRGGWFFQIRKDRNGILTLLEVASRIAGTSAYTRSKGVNLPLLTLYLYSGNNIDYVQENRYEVVIDRALHNSYATNIEYDNVYIDYDDTLFFENKINIQLVAFIFQCINNNIPVRLITKHTGNLLGNLKEKRIYDLFDEIIRIKSEENKFDYIKGPKSIFIDDSFGERISVFNKLNIHVFDSHMIEFLMNPLLISSCSKMS
jgi:hypothetical protein